MDPLINKPVIELKGISYLYEESTEPALQEISLSICRGEWVTIAGPSRSGKTTLCGLLCGMLQSWPGGVMQGSMLINDQDMAASTASDLAGQVGIVFQDPETGLIQEYVEDELAFGPENLRFSTMQIEQNILDALAAIVMPEARSLRTDELSGGQKQRISIASVLTMQPQILILDDATANLDAASAERLMDTLHQLHHRGHTIIMTSSRLEPNCPADRIMLLNEGRLIAEGTWAELSSRHHDLLMGLGCLPNSEPISRSPISFIQQEPILQVQQLGYSYRSVLTHAEQPVLKSVNLELYPGDILAVLGPNGSGKTTFGKLLAGLLPAPKNSIWIRGSDLTQYTAAELAQTVGYLFQNPEHQFVADTVIEECIFGLHMRNGIQPPGKKASAQLTEQFIALGDSWLSKFGLAEYRNLNPFHLSAADKQLLNLASVLILEPDLIILDEPTAGLSYTSTDLLMSYCLDYASQGKAIVMITHDSYVTEGWATKEIMLE
jgi:energy-coupling factor transporter ATP-binding protein EcfA2